MTNRDDFSAETKKILAQRAGYRCSFPGCGVQTIGPSSENASATANVGMACHIVAAASGRGARRVNSSMTGEERSAYGNGIWMCFTHGKLIDSDEVRFTISILQQWREVAERRAELALRGAQLNVKNHGLLTHEITVTVDALEESLVGNAFIDAAVPMFWGKAISEAVRDLAFEITQNALTHGRAQSVAIRFEPKRITIVDNGCEFDPKRLSALPGGRGGTAALRALRTVGGDQLQINYSRSACQNMTAIQFIQTQDDFDNDTPCHLNFEHDLGNGITATQEALASVENCDVVYIVLPDFMAFSKASDFHEYLKINLPSALENKQIVFVGREISQSVKNLLAEVEGSRFLALDGNPGRYWAD